MYARKLPEMRANGDQTGISEQARATKLHMAQVNDEKQPPEGRCSKGAMKKPNESWHGKMKPKRLSGVRSLR